MEGSYTIKVKARDIHGGESEWSDPLSISMPKYKKSSYLNQVLFNGEMIQRFCVMKFFLRVMTNYIVRR